VFPDRQELFFQAASIYNVTLALCFQQGYIKSELNTASSTALLSPNIVVILVVGLDLIIDSDYAKLYGLMCVM